MGEYRPYHDYMLLHILYELGNIHINVYIILVVIQELAYIFGLLCREVRRKIDVDGCTYVTS